MFTKAFSSRAADDIGHTDKENMSFHTSSILVLGFRVVTLVKNGMEVAHVIERTYAWNPEGGHSGSTSISSVIIGTNRCLG